MIKKLLLVFILLLAAYFFIPANQCGQATNNALHEQCTCIGYSFTKEQQIRCKGICIQNTCSMPESVDDSVRLELYEQLEKPSAPMAKPSIKNIVIPYAKSKPFYYGVRNRYAYPVDFDVELRCFHAPDGSDCSDFVEYDDMHVKAGKVQVNSIDISARGLSPGTYRWKFEVLEDRGIYHSDIFKIEVVE